MQCRQIVGKAQGIKPSMIKWIYTAIIRPIMSYAYVLGWRSQQKVSGEETHKDAESCWPEDFNSFCWHPYWCSAGASPAGGIARPIFISAPPPPIYFLPSHCIFS